jgi:hypothetical protein
MNTQWYYTHAGHTFGPHTGDDLHRLAALGLLRPEDPLWPEGSDPQGAVAATAAIDFSMLPAPRLDPPDWLADVADAQQVGPQTVEWPALGAPDWLEDMWRLQNTGGAKPPAESVPAVQAESSEGVYQRARAAIHAWAELEANKSLILTGDCDTVRQDAAVQMILRVVEQCGPHYADRFGRHLEFVVHTRRKQYLHQRK